MKDPEPGKEQNTYVRRRRQDLRRLAKAGELDFTDDYVYRPGELLVSASDDNRIASKLKDWGCNPDQSMNERLRDRGLELRRWRLAEGASVPDLVRRLRRVDPARPPVAGPNHVFGSEPRWAWGGGGAPSPADAFASTKPTQPSEGVRIGVLDTGVAADTEQLHPQLFAHLTDPAGDLDNLDDDGDGYLDSGAGHGTFVLGILHRLAPQAVLDVEPVLGAHGFGDDLSIALGASEIKGAVINLSFGGYTYDNMEPPGLRAALNLLGRKVVVVAAAGNHGSKDPFWPAAFPEVIAVAAVDTRDLASIVPASFTNRGAWVDICAPGVDIHSTYVHGTWPAGGGVKQHDFDGHARWSGTSFAAPHVAAAIATLAADKGISPRDAADAFVGGLSPLPGHTGMGRLYLPPKDLVLRA
jgi:hypothetical protein